MDIISGQDNKIAERTQFEITGQKATSPNNKMQITLKNVSINWQGSLRLMIYYTHLR